MINTYIQQGVTQMKLSNNFTLKELCKSSTAIRLGIKNTPDKNQIEKLKALCENIVQKVREHYGVSFSPNSGFRCLELNRVFRSRDTSQHRLGEAVDIEVPGVSNYDLACWIRDNLDADKVILEFYKSGEPSSGWVHVSFREGNNRNKCYTISKKGTEEGLIE